MRANHEVVNRTRGESPENANPELAPKAHDTTLAEVNVFHPELVELERDLESVVAVLWETCRNGSGEENLSVRRSLEDVRHELRALFHR